MDLVVDIWIKIGKWITKCLMDLEIGLENWIWAKLIGLRTC